MNDEVARAGEAPKGSAEHAGQRRETARPEGPQTPREVSARLRDAPADERFEHAQQSGLRRGEAPEGLHLTQEAPGLNEPRAPQRAGPRERGGWEGAREPRGEEQAYVKAR